MKVVHIQRKTSKQYLKMCIDSYTRYDNLIYLLTKLCEEMSKKDA